MGREQFEVGANIPLPMRMQAKARVPQPIRSAEAFTAGGFADRTPIEMSASSMFFGDGGRKHYGQSGGSEGTFKPGRRKLYPNDSSEHKHGGLKQLAIPKVTLPPRAQQRHLPHAQGRSGYDVPERSIELALNRKVLVRRDDHSLARDYISTEQTLERAFGVKKKTGDIVNRRNGIPVNNPGDKLYSGVDYSPNFFKEFNSEFSRVGGANNNGGSTHEIAPPGMSFFLSIVDCFFRFLTLLS
jgi:hypothetical protein